MNAAEWQNIVCVAQYLNAFTLKQFPDSNPWIGSHMTPKGAPCEFIVLHDSPANPQHPEMNGELARERFIEKLEDRFPSAYIESFDSQVGSDYQALL